MSKAHWHRVPVAAVVLVAAVLCASCGSDSGSKTVLMSLYFTPDPSAQGRASTSSMDFAGAWVGHGAERALVQHWEGQMRRSEDAEEDEVVFRAAYARSHEAAGDDLVVWSLSIPGKALHSIARGESPANLSVTVTGEMAAEPRLTIHISRFQNSRLARGPGYVAWDAAFTRSDGDAGRASPQGGVWAPGTGKLIVRVQD